MGYKINISQFGKNFGNYFDFYDEVSRNKCCNFIIAKFNGDFKKIVDAMKNKTWENELTCSYYNIKKESFGLVMSVRVISNFSRTFLRVNIGVYSIDIDFVTGTPVQATSNLPGINDLILGTFPIWSDIYVPEITYEYPSLPVLPISNWLKMHMLDQKIYNANANNKIIEIREKESNVLVDTVAILGGFITVAGFMKAGAVIAEQPFRDVSNYLKPSTFNEYIMPGVYNSASSYLQNASSVLGNINKLSINQANVEALKQATIPDIGTATATGTFIYGAMGTLAKNILGAVFKYGRFVLPAINFTINPTELGAGSDFSYNGIIYTAKARPVVTQQDNWQFQQTVNTHSSNQATTEATQGTTTEADAQKEADATAQHEQNNIFKNGLDALKTAIGSQAKSIVDTLKALSINLTIPEGATIPLGFDTVALKDFFTANKLGIDTSAFQEWLGIHGLNINTTSFQEWLGTHGLNIDIESLQTFINTHGLSIDTTALQSILQNGLRLDAPNSINLNAPDSINLVAPESIELVADGLKLALDDVSGQSLKTIGDQITARNTLESTRAEKESSVLDLQKDVLQDKKDMAQTNNDLARANLGVSTSELAVRGAKYGSTEQFNYLQTQQKSFENFHDSKVVTHTDSTGQTMQVQSGLIAFLGETLPALFNEGLTRVMGQNKATDGLLEDVEERLDQVFSTIFSLFNIKVEELPSSTSENLSDFDKDSLEWFEKYQAGKGQSTKVSEVVE